MLTEEQKSQVAGWFAAGASLDEIQKRVKAEFGVHMTYLDVRLMVAELPQPAEPEPPAQAPGEGAAPVPGAERNGAAPVPGAQNAEGGAPVPGAPNGELPPGAPKRYDLDAPDADEGNPVPDVVVELDALTIPGTYASGDVTFSDGVKGKWYLDQQGRLGLGNAPEGYRPSQTDMAIFQSRLMELLQSRGGMM